MKTTAWGCLTLLLAACGGSTDADPGGNGGTDAGLGGSSGGGGAGASGAGGVGAGGSGATSGTAGAAGSGATGATGGFAGASGAPSVTPCVGLDYCDCISSNASCQFFAEACYCPCGVEPCTPNCDCGCAGGKYLGCGPSSIHDPGAVEGIWLVGWGGGMNHYSWVRFRPGGQADFLDGADIVANAPLWPCNGTGSWGPTAKPETIQLMRPASCGGEMEVLTFDKLGPGGFPKEAVLSASITALTISVYLEGYKFPDSHCNASMTQCKSPF